MNLEACIERDMVRFLESAVTVAEKTEVPRAEDAASVYANQWQEQIQSHLKRNDIDGAKKAFNQLKEHYNATPEDHAQERKSLYELVQTCYLDIVNYLQEQERTHDLLRKMEQAPSDVFNTNVRPVNLQVVERTESTHETHDSARQQPVIVVQMTAPVIQSTPVEQRFAPVSSSVTPPSLPPVPSPPLPPVFAPAPAPSTLPPSASASSAVSMPSRAPPQVVAQPPVVLEASAPVQASAPVVVSAAPAPNLERERERRERQIISSVHVTMKRCLELGKSDPAQALAELRELGTTILSEEQLLHVSRIIAKQLIGQIEELERSIRNAQERQSFDRSFQISYTQLAALARSKQAAAIPLFDSLRSKAKQYEQTNPSAKNMYTEKLSQLQNSFGLFSEADLIARVAPLITRLKIAQQTRSLTAFDNALYELDRLSRSLPHTTERAELEQTVQALRTRRESLARAVATTSTSMVSTERRG